MRRLLAVIVAAGVLAHAWWVTALPPFDATSAAAVVGSGVAAMALGSRAHRPPGSAHLRGADVAAWVVPFGALAALQLAAFLQHPRREHPTLSSLAGPLLEGHAARTLAFTAWLAGAAWLARR